MIEQAVVSLTPDAQTRLRDLLAKEGNPQLALRIFVSGGGCSGMQYGMAFDDMRRPEDVTIEHLDNPRVELPEHYYNVKHTKLVELGLEPHLLSDTLIESLFEVTKRYAHRVRLEALRPTVKWREPTAE